MGYRNRRKLIKIGKTSKAVILPKAWLDYHGDKANHLIVLGDAILVIAPEEYEDEAKHFLELIEEERAEHRVEVMEALSLARKRANTLRLKGKLEAG